MSENILERAAALVRWHKGPAGYMAGEDAPQKIAEAFTLLEQLTAEPTLAMKAENCDLHIKVRHLEARIARLTDPDAQIAHVRNARRAAAGVIAALERRIERLEAAAAPAGTIEMIGIVGSNGALVSGLHVLASDAWNEFESGASTCLESAWQDGYRDALYRCQPARASADVPLTPVDAVRVKAAETGD